MHTGRKMLLIVDFAQDAFRFRVDLAQVIEQTAEPLQLMTERHPAYAL
jgi:hypothetical protein